MAEEAGPEEAVPTKERGVAPAMLTNLHKKPVLYIGNLENQPGYVLTSTSAPGGTTRAPGPTTTGTSLQVLK